MTTKKLIRELHADATSYLHEFDPDESNHNTHQQLLLACQKALQLTEKLMHHMPYAASGAAAKLSQLASALSSLYESTALLSPEVVPSRRAEKRAFVATLEWVGYTKTLKQDLEHALQHHKFNVARVKEHEAEERAAAKKAAPARTKKATPAKKVTAKTKA